MHFFIILLLGVLAMANHLQNSDSPYLIQHADNPVDWYPWGEEALKKAKKENKLIFLSIGYSTCHWCHVMERESFENKEIAKILNKNFVSIKVDREEMPDLDKYYQKVYQLMHRRGGGWPLTIIMTPDKKPFYSATYIPPHTTHFGAGLEELLLMISNDWKKNPKKIEEIGNNVIAYLNKKEKFPKEKIDKSILKTIISELQENQDLKNGGLKGAPKFPQEALLNLLIDTYQLTNDKKVLDFLNLTLTKMAKGGIFDQIEGGFYRYSTDEKWEIPHFEKMLYNNANLPIIYLKMYKITKNPLFKEVAVRSIEEMIKRYSQNYLFFSASNAESENVEGKYFTFEYDEVVKAFNKFPNREELLNYFGIKKYGNLNGRNNPVINGEKPQNYEEALKTLQNLRSKKAFPFIDTKKITAWNAMMIKSLFTASEFNKKYLDFAEKSLDNLIKKMYINGTLYHSFNKDENQKREGLLEDYAYLISALITAYEYSYNEKYLKLAQELTKKVFVFKKENWYMNREHSIEADFSDSAYSSSLSILANDFIDLATLSYDLNLYNEGKEIIKNGSYFAKKYPLYYPTITIATLKEIFNEYVITSEKPLFKENFNYPFVLWKKGENYEICTIEKCLKKGTLKEILEFLNKK